MATITGTTGNDTLTVLTDTTSIQAGAGTDIVIFSGNYADYTFSQSDSYVTLMTHNTTGQAVSLYGVEQLQFDDGLIGLSISGSGVVSLDGSIEQYPSVAGLSNGYILGFKLKSKKN